MASAVLYSYRRCPYAMRARMALKYAGIDVEIREISLREKPAAMLAASPKGTVPVLVLVLPDARVIDESLDIARWALTQRDVDNWLLDDPSMIELIAENDGSFKQALDRYKYAERFPEHPQAFYRTQGELFLARLESMLSEHRYLFRGQPCLADIAIFPFVRQFAAVDTTWFDNADYPKLRAWLQGLLESELFLGVMQKYPTWTDAQIG